ncbi:MAG: hypothetical protein HFI91_04650 [Lachnospiraceae bacterium]|jgi:hypothetical protein|nr:hypothetical protein [Lachnospiraceae bacterium]
MKEKGIRLAAFFVIAAAMLYFFTCSVIGEYFIYNGRARKILYLLLILLLSGLITFLISRKTSVLEMFYKFSMKELLTKNTVRFHLERLDVCLLALIVLGGAILRVSGVDWGITSIFQSDEGKLVKPALQMAIDAWPYDGNMGYPNQLVSKLAAVCFMIYTNITGIELTTGTIDGYFIFRTITAVFSICTVITAFFIGNYLKPHLGVIFAALVSVFPEFNGLSKQVTADTIALFFMSLVVLASLLYLERASVASAVGMSLFAAMATMEKWHSAVACFYIAVVVVMQSKTLKAFFSHGILTFFVYVAGLCLIAPNGFWHFNGMVRGLSGMYTYDKDGVHTYGELLHVYLGRLSQYTGLIFGALLIVGIFFIWKERRREYVILLLGVLKLVAICFLNRGFPRWGLEFYFMVLCLASTGAYALWVRQEKWMKLVGAGAFCMVLLSLGFGSILVTVTAVKSGQDTRLLQDEYCRSHNITEENSVYEYYTGFEPGGINTRREKRETFETIEDSFVVEKGRLYKTSERILYAIDNCELYTAEVHDFLQKECPVEKSFASVGPDIFTGAVEGLDGDIFEWGLMEKNIKQIQKILSGSSMGPEIIIYDVKDVPVLPNRQTEEQ